MAGKNGLSKVCVPLHAPVFALNIACHAHFRDGVFGVQHVGDVANGGMKEGVTWCVNWGGLRGDAPPPAKTIWHLKIAWHLRTGWIGNPGK